VPNFGMSIANGNIVMGIVDRLQMGTQS